MTMAFSMENRVPFLGKEFISDIRGGYTSKSLVKSNSLLFGDGVISHGTKIPLKKLSSSIFGKEFTYRKKQGFGFPLVEIMNHPKFNELFHDQCLPKIKDQSILDIHSCESLWSQRNLYPHEAFTLLSYSTWLSIVS
jgi:asparagine synthase (glutamine-hydrolysing)